MQWVAFGCSDAEMFLCFCIVVSCWDVTFISTGITCYSALRLCWTFISHHKLYLGSSPHWWIPSKTPIETKAVVPTGKTDVTVILASKWHRHDGADLVASKRDDSLARYILLATLKQAFDATRTPCPREKGMTSVPCHMILVVVEWWLVVRFSLLQFKINKLIK